MLINYLKIIFRGFMRSKWISISSISGLVVSMLFFILTGLYVFDELSFDSHNERYNRIYRLTYEMVVGSNDPIEIAGAPVSSGPVLEQDYPHLVSGFVRITPLMENDDILVKFGNKEYRTKYVYATEKRIFDVFTFEFIEGNQNSSLNQPNSVILTESLAASYFGDNWQDADILNKVLFVGYDNYKITGVIRDLPENTNLQINALTSKKFEDDPDWLDGSMPITYLLLKNNISEDEFIPKLSEVVTRYINPQVENLDWDQNNKKGKYEVTFSLKIKSLGDIHFDSGVWFDSAKGNKTYLVIFVIMSLLLLATASINNINLSIAKAMQRSREIGVRKVLGAGKWQLFVQLMGESVAKVFIALALAILLAQALLPYYSQLLFKDFNLATLFEAKFIVYAALALFVVGFVSGCYPALLLSSFQPAKVLKGEIPTQSRFGLRKALVAGQLFFSCFMVICTWMIFQQLQYMKDKDPGFDKEQVVTVYAPAELSTKKGLEIRDVLKGHPNFANTSVVGVSSSPGYRQFGVEEIESNDGERELQTYNIIYVDENYLQLLNVNLLAGHGYNERQDYINGVIVNETFVKQMRWQSADEAIGKAFPIYDGLIDGAEGRIIGVVNDYHYQSYHQKIQPLAIAYNQNGLNSFELLVKVKSNRELELVKKVWKDHTNGETFEYSFLDDVFNEKYKQETGMMTFFGYISAANVALSCLGLFGLVIFNIQRQTKEMGIRKIFGASAWQIYKLFTTHYIKLVLIAGMAAIPFAYIVISVWLQNYAYKIELDALPFILALFVVALTMILTVSIQTLKAANANPVKSLRYE